MQLTVDKTVMLKNLEQALGVIERKSTMPILTHCLLEANGQGLVISATDLEMNYQGISPAEVRDPGVCTVLAHSLHSLVKSLPPGELELTGSEGKLTLSTGASHYQLLTRDPDEFPPLPPPPEEGWVEIGADTLTKLLGRVMFSMSADDLQYHLSATNWAKVDRDGTPHLRLVSTDGHRLSLVDHPFPALADLDFGKDGLLVPAKAMREIDRLAKNQAKGATLRFGLKAKTGDR
jgi:DNA polymerase-3 subunit beta